MKKNAYIITGPTTGIGRPTALELAKHGTVILVGRDRQKLRELQKQIERKGQQAYSVLCDLSEPESVERAAAEILALDLPIAALLNNAGIRQTKATRNSRGWDMTFATNHLGPFALTEALIPHLPNGAHVVFVASAVEDPERIPARRAGFRGGRYISTEACARGEWLPGGSKIPGADAYATSKQCNLATVLFLARETPRLRFSAIEPGVSINTGLSRDMSPFIRLIATVLLPPLVPLFMPFFKFLSTPERAAKVITKIVVDTSAKSGAYYDESGQLKLGSDLVRDPNFNEKVVAETRAFLAANLADKVR